MKFVFSDTTSMGVLRNNHFTSDEVKSRFPTQPLLMEVRLEVLSVVFAWGRIVFV